MRFLEYRKKYHSILAKTLHAYRGTVLKEVYLELNPGLRYAKSIKGSKGSHLEV